MIADKLESAGTLVVEDVLGLTTLCLDTGSNSLPLALFVSATAARQFSAALANALQAAHASGRSGI